MRPTTARDGTVFEFEALLHPGTREAEPAERALERSLRPDLVAWRSARPRYAVPATGVPVMWRGRRSRSALNGARS
jgi:hypothetical protein